MKIPANIQIGIALGLVALGAFWLLSRKGVAQGIAQGVVTATGNLVVGTATGVVKGAGAVVGIPDTEQSRCDQAILAGDGWSASLYCPATQYLQYVAGTHPLQKLPPQKVAAPGTLAFPDVGAMGDPRVPGLGTGGVVTPGIPAKDLKRRAPKPITVLEPDLSTDRNGTFAEQSTSPSYPW